LAISIKKHLLFQKNGIQIPVNKTTNQVANLKINQRISVQYKQLIL